MIHPNGRQEWYVDGRLHRSDGPAVIRADGRQEWYVDGQRHRLDGPAVIYADGTQVWYVRGVDLTDAVAAWMESQKIKYPWDLETQVYFQLTWG